MNALLPFSNDSSNLRLPLVGLHCSAGHDAGNAYFELLDGSGTPSPLGLTQGVDYWVYVNFTGWSGSVYSPVDETICPAAAWVQDSWPVLPTPLGTPAFVSGYVEGSTWNALPGTTSLVFQLVQSIIPVDLSVMGCTGT